MDSEINEALNRGITIVVSPHQIQYGQIISVILAQSCCFAKIQVGQIVFDVELQLAARASLD